MNKEEIWVPVDGTDDRYEVSSEGRVRALWFRNGWRNVRRAEPLILKACGPRYLLVGVTIDGRRVTPHVHKLVAAAFHGPRPAGLHIAHLNGDARDNRAENLAYVTPTENEHHKHGHGTRLAGERCHNAKLTDDQVREIRRTVIPRHPVYSVTALARKFGVWPGTISAVVNGRLRRHYTPEAPLS